jgi:S1-C subfamily serine protease
MVLTPTGVVLTNKHVIEGETSISVRDVGNETWYHADVLGYDRSLDVVVLQLVGASHLQKVKFGNSSKVSVGEGVIAGGNGEGAGGTPSHVGGAITAVDQSITAQDEISGSTEQLTGRPIRRS